MGLFRQQERRQLLKTVTIAIAIGRTFYSLPFNAECQLSLLAFCEFDDFIMLLQSELVLLLTLAIKQ